MTPHRVYQFEAALTRAGWLSPAFVAVDGNGIVTSVEKTSPTRAIAVDTQAGWFIPGFQNAHSHAFQYAMAGLAEHLPEAAKADDFWSWREAMYRLALKVSPEAVEAVAAML